MTWDPELDDPSDARRRPLDTPVGDVGADHARDVGDEPPPAWRDAPPDRFSPIDPDSPISGHVPPPEKTTSISESPEQSWETASHLIYPTFRPVGTMGTRLSDVHPEVLVAQTGRAHVAPLVDDGPAGLPVAFALQAGGFDILVNAEHVLSWGVEPAEIERTALRNLAGWSASAAWTDEASGERRLLSSDTGDGWDAVRILLPEVRDHLQRELGGAGRVLVGLPERHLLVAGSLAPNDEDFAGLFGDFVADQSEGADEPIDRRVFELVDGELVEFGSDSTP